MRSGNAALVCGLCIVWNCSLLGRTFVVAPGGNDSQVGSLTAPWRTLAKANSSLASGDTVLVRGGTYHERIVPARSGSNGSPIVYRSFPGELVVVDGPDDTDINLVTVSKSWIVIEGFTFRNQDYFDLPMNSDYWVVLDGTHIVFRYNRLIADGDVFSNIYVRNAASRGIAETGQYNTIEHCFVRGLSFGIVIAGSSPRFTLLRYDTVYASGQNNIDVGATGDGTTAYHGTLIEYCVLDTSIIEDNIQFEPDYGDPTSTLHNRGTIIRHTIMGNAAENAIDLKGAGHTIIENNLIYSSSGDDDGPLGGHDVGSGGGVTANANTPTRNTIVRRNVIWDHSTGLDMAEGDHYFNNTILNNRRTWQGPNQSGTSHVALRAFSYPNTKRAFLNNIVAGQQNGGVFEWLMDWGGKFHLDNNLYYDTGAPARFIHRKNGSLITTVGLNSWKSELSTYAGYGYMQGKDVSALEADPGFLNAPIQAVGYDPSWNFGLKSSSPAIDAGRALTFATGAGTASTSLAVDDAYFFCDGFGITDGDEIRIGGDVPVRILVIDYGRNILTLGEPRSWSAGAGVHLSYNGNAPDIGALESGTSGPLPSPPGIINLYAPVDGIRDLPLQSFLSWIPVAGVLSYHVEVSLTTSFGSKALDVYGVTGTSLPITSLAGSTTYYWRVRGANRGGFGAWSAARSFTTVVTSGSSGKDGPELLQNGDFENGSQGWTFFTSGTGGFSTRGPAFKGSSAGRITITSAGNNIQLYQAGITLSADSYYRLTFTAYSSTGHDLAVGLMQHGPPYSDYGLWTRRVSLETNWRTYNVYLRTSNFAGTVDDGRLQFWFPEFAEAGDEYWLDDITFQQIDVPPLPGSSQFLIPAPGAIEQPNILTLHWAAVDGADGYLVQLATDPLFVQMVCDSVINDTLLTVGPLESSTCYYRRIRALNVGGSGPLSPYCSFSTIVAKTSIDLTRNKPNQVNLEQNFPNPFNPSTVVRYSLPRQTYVTLTVYNALGVEVAVLEQGERSSGEHVVPFEARGLASGAYFYTLAVDGAVETRKMLLLR